MTATQTQLRRGTAAQVAAMTPVEGEVVVNTTDERIHVGDGTQAGGYGCPNLRDIQQQKAMVATVGGTANAITLTHSPVVGSYVTGLRTIFKATSDSSTAITLNVDGLGTKDAKYVLDNVLTAFDSTTILKSGLYYEAVYDGTQFQVLGIGKTSSTPAGMVYLATGTASNSATLDFTSLITSTYDDYVVIIDNALPATDGASLILRTSTDNGSSYDSSGYWWVATMLTAPSTSAVSGSASDSGITVASGISNNSSINGASGRVDLFNLLFASGYQGIHFKTNYANSAAGGSFRSFNGTGVRAQGTPTAINALRFLMSSGNITSGTIKMYGVSKS